MAKKSVVARDARRKKLAARYRQKRIALRALLINAGASDEQRWEAMLALQKLPRDSSAARQRNRCALSGRPRGFYRKFGLSRSKLREVVMNGEAPGVVKASW